MRVRVKVVGVVDMPDALARLALGSGDVPLFAGMKIPFGHGVEATVVEGLLTVSRYRPESVKG